MRSNKSPFFEQYVLWSGLTLTIPVLSFISATSLRSRRSDPAGLVEGLIIGFVAISLLIKLDVREAVKVAGVGGVIMLALAPAAYVIRIDAGVSEKASEVPAAEDDTLHKRTARPPPASRTDQPSDMHVEAPTAGRSGSLDGLPSDVRGRWTLLPDGRHRFTWGIETEGRTYWCGEMFLKDVTPAATRLLDVAVRESRDRLRITGDNCVSP